MHKKDFDGRFVLRIMDEFLQKASDLVTCVIFDGATAHQTLKRTLLGMPTNADRGMLQDMKFLSCLEFRDLPEHCLPRLPVQIPCVDGEPFIALPGVCDLS